MNQEVYDYRATEEIKHITIGIQRLRCRRNVEREHYLKSQDSRIDYLKHAKESAKHELLDMIGDFILVKELNDGFYIEAELYLPYVRDSKIKELEDLAYFWEKDSMRHRTEITGLCREINLLKRSWYKKLWAKIKNY